MKLRTTLLLLLLTAGLIGYVVFHENRQPPRNLSGYLLFDLKGNPLLDGEVSVEVDQKAVRGIDLKSPAGDLAFRLQKDGTWDMARGLKDRANGKVIRTLLDFCDKARIEDILSAEEVRTGKVKEQELGLDDAGAMRLIYRKEGAGRMVELRVGKTVPLGNAMYVKVMDEEMRPDIYLVSPDLRDMLARPINDFRDPNLCKYPVERLKRVAIRRGEGLIELSRDSTDPEGGPASSWVISRPLPNARASQPVVNDFLSQLVGVKVESFIPGTPAAATPAGGAADEKPLLEISLWSDQPEERKGGVRLAFFDDVVKDSKNVICRDRERLAEFKVSRAVVEELSAAESPDAFRDTMLGNIDPKLVTALDIQVSGGEPVRLDRIGDRWVMRAPGQKELTPAAGERVEDLIKDLNESPILEFTSDSLADPALYGLNPPLAILTFGGEANDGRHEPPPLTPQNSRSLRLGLTADGKVFANYLGEPFVYRVGPEVPGFVPLQRIRWRSLQLPGFSVRNVKTIRQSVGASPALELIRDNFNWKATREGSDVTKMLDVQAAEEMVSLFGSLQVGSWQQEATTALAALQKAPIVLEAVYEYYGNTNAEKLTGRFRVEFAPMKTDRPSPLYFGRHSGVEGTFLIDAKTVHSLCRNLLGPPR